ncbi:hypothetical protein [Micromonospora sp. NPDC005197]|uniref:hypothetical protein n=1 Tax=unclassified Micromonospora TaxID=2617518 RepID=UPI0033A8B708
MTKLERDSRLDRIGDRLRQLVQSTLRSQRLRDLLDQRARVFGCPAPQGLHLRIIIPPRAPNGEA